MSRMNDDTISRQAAIKALWAIKNERESVYYTSAIYNAVDAIEALPSAERRGRWIEEYSANHFQAKCSACGESTLYGITYDLEGNAYYMNYCPNCGARMEAE